MSTPVSRSLRGSSTASYLVRVRVRARVRVRVRVGIWVRVS